MQIDSKDKPVVLALLTLAIGLGLNALVSLAEHSNPKNTGRNNEDPYEIPKLILEALEAVATVGIAGYAVLQYRASDRSSERELRAYVAAKVRHCSSFDATTRIWAKIDMSNVGLTPALKLRNRCSIELLDYPYVPGQSLPDLTGAFTPPMPLFPRADFYGRTERNYAFNAAEIVAILNGTKRIHIYGEVIYFDIFQRTERMTRFCQAVIADAATLQKLCSNYSKADLEVSFEIAPMGNDAT